MTTVALKTAGQHVAMENDIVVGVGARAATVDRYDFAEAALSQVFSIALELATNKSLCVAGRLAAQLHIARGVVESAADPKLHSRILKLLRDLERVCAWPDVPSDRMIITQALVHHEQRAKNRVKKGIINFAKSSTNKFEKPLAEQYFKNLSRFSEAILASDNRRNGINKTGSKSAADEYPMHVNDELYTILKTYSLCTCVSNHNSRRSRHYARLRLQDKIVEIEENIAFEMLFSESPTTCHHWQHLQIRVPLRRKSAKAVNFNPEVRQNALGSPEKGKRKMWVVKPDEFCNLFASKVGSRICCHIQDSELHRLRRGLEITQNVKAGDSLLLRDLFSLGRLSNQMKLRLAYIVAKSFWQYYDSPWMGSSWTSDSVHFLRESLTGYNHPRGDIYASKPYFAVDSKELDSESIEYCDEPGVVFPYPRLLSLCIILLEIGRGQALAIEDKGSLVANLNERWHLAKRLMRQLKGRHGFDYVDYQEAIASCLNNTTWEQDSDSVETDAFARKAVIHDVIVQPLEKLLEKCFSDTQHAVGPVDQSSALSESAALPEAPVMPKTSSDVDESERWIDLMKRINAHFLKLLSPEALAKRPRVAILDTGFDGSSSFLDIQGRRIDDWKDFAGSSQDLVDEAGHGTHTAATAMKVAPHARMYVARIAKDMSSLRKASQAIADAIDWAANQVNVDIISMSFGFPNEVPVITAAIRKVTLDRNGRLMFFAAASNAGGNGKEMFPANLDEVFSIRETNSRGAFSDTNPPVNPNGPICFDFPRANFKGVIFLSDLVIMQECGI
ncbi:putative subtilisin [Colletotrichum sp. SAR 10_98]|nr:putative subtilisin [Colletotrichum sp. SAR 10_98]